MRWLLLSLFLVVGIAQSNEPPKPKGPDRKPAAEQRGSEESPLFITTPRPTTQADRDYEAYEKNEKPIYEKKTTNATVALAWITGVLALFTAGLWLATRKLVLDAQETSKRQLRAYICLVGGAITLENGGKFLRIYVQMKNFGQTPAHNVTSWITHEICASPPTKMLAGERVGEILARGVRPPNVTLDLLIDHEISPEQIRSLNDKIQKIWIWGCIEYLDVFDRPQWVNIRTRSGKINGAVGWTLEPEDNAGNEAS